MDSVVTVPLACFCTVLTQATFLISLEDLPGQIDRHDFEVGLPQDGLAVGVGGDALPFEDVGRDGVGVVDADGRLIYRRRRVPTAGFGRGRCGPR